MRKLIVILSAAALVLAFTLPVMAQSEWSFYGNSRMWLEWANYDKEAPSNPGCAGFDDEELTWTLQSNSRIGANVAAGDIGGRFEYGTGINLRLLYGTWNFGPGTILAGQDYTPVQWVISSQCGLGGGDCGFIGWGTYYTGRVPQIKLSMGGFQVALMDMGSLSNPLSGSLATKSTAVWVDAGDTPPTTGTALVLGGALGDLYEVPGTDGFSCVDTDATLPEIEAGYTFNFGPGAFFIGGAFHSHDAVGIYDGAENDYSIDAWAIQGGWKLGFGPFYFNGAVWFGQNPGDYGVAFAPGMEVISAVYCSDTNSIEDVDAFHGQFNIGFVVSDMLKLEGGYSYYTGEVDAEPSITTEQTVNAWYVQAAISPVKNVFLIPEIGVIDYGDYEETGQADVDLGKATYFGMKFQINF
jgi:hypothetical protein